MRPRHIPAPPRRTGRAPVTSVAFILLAVALIACGGKDKGAPEESTPDVAGTYSLVGDVNGTQVRPGASVTLQLNGDGTLSLHAIQPGEELSDSGTWSVHGDRMSIELKDLGVSAKDQPFRLEGESLEIPIQIFGDGPGASQWRKSTAAAAQPTAAPGSTPAVTAGVSGISTSVPVNWQIYDIEKYATASAMKTFLESVNDRHQSWEEAVKSAAAKARAFSDVSDVVISPNGLNATIRYKDGRDEDLITERFTVTQAAGRGALPPSNHYAAAAPPPGRPVESLAAFAAAECSALPAAPSGLVKVGQRNLPEPGREGLQPSPGVFLVPTYNPKAQPTPIKTEDSPESRKALLFAPLYEVPHPGPVYNSSDQKVVGMWSGFKETTGSNIECISADLTSARYTPETVLGHVQSNRRLETGLDALLILTRKLTTTNYGVLYFLTHGAELSERVLKMEMGALDDADRTRIVGNGKLGHEQMMKLQDAIREQVAKEAGLADDDEFKRTIFASTDINGFVELWISADFFRLLRERKNLDFSAALVFVNGCSSAANLSFQSAFDSKAYFGWDQPPDLNFASDAAERIVDLLPDKARSVRNAWQMWVRYEGWVNAAAGVERPARAKIERLKAYGQHGVEYPKMADQTVVLIYRMRFGPPGGAEGLQSSLNVVTACWTQYWSAGKAVTGLQSPACSMIQLSSNRAATKEEYEDAVFEVGGPGEPAYGRWTLAD